MTAVFDPGAQAARATDAILADTLGGTSRGIVVDSPPGAGKSTLVVRAALELAAAGHPLMVVAQTNAQVDDLVVRLAEKDPGLPVGGCTAMTPTRTTRSWTGWPTYGSRRRRPISPGSTWSSRRPRSGRT